MIKDENSTSHCKKVTEKAPYMKTGIGQRNTNKSKYDAPNNIKGIDSIHLTRSDYLFVVLASAAAGGIIGGCLMAALLRRYGGN